MALVQRSMANQEICTAMERGLIRAPSASMSRDGRSECNTDLNADADCIDVENNYRCKFNGFGSTDIGGTPYYDLGSDMLVDRFELSCDTQAGGVSYLPDNGGWRNECVGDDINTGVGISNAAFLPPQAYIDQNESYTACENSLEALKFDGQNHVDSADGSFKMFDDDIYGYSRRLLTKKEWHAAAAWDYYRIGHANVGAMKYGASTRSCNTSYNHSKGNATSVLYGGHFYTQYYATNSDGTDCYDGSWGEYVCNFLGGSSGTYSTDDCVSRYGLQDHVGGVWEWTATQINTATNYTSNGVQGTGLINNLNFDGDTAYDETSGPHLSDADYYNFALGLPMMCTGGGFCSADDYLIGKSGGNNNIDVSNSRYLNGAHLRIGLMSSYGLLSGGGWENGTSSGRDLSYLRNSPGHHGAYMGLRCGFVLQ